MFFQIGLYDRLQFIHVYFARELLTLAEVGDIDLDLAQEMKDIQNKDCAEKHRNCRRNQWDVNEPRYQHGNDAQDDTAGNLHGQSFGFDIDFHYIWRRAAAQNTKEIDKKMNFILVATVRDVIWARKGATLIFSECFSPQLRHASI